MSESNSVRTSHRITYGDETIAFEVRRQSQRVARRVAIHIEACGTVHVDAPVDASEQAVVIAVKRRARWIHQHILAIRRRQAHMLPREFVSGEAVVYLGRRYRLKVMAADQGQCRVRLFGGFLEVHVVNKTPEHVAAAMDVWLRDRARIILSERMQALVPSLRWLKQIPPWRMQAMRVQWGSCSPAGRLTLNPYLVGAPRECIDYVIVHELCHVREHNHSRRFYRLLDRHLPDWRQRKARLDEIADMVLRT